MDLHLDLYSYFKPTSGLPDPRRRLFSDITPKAISLANKEINHILKQSSIFKRRGAYTTYTPKLRAEIGRCTIIHGTSAWNFLASEGKSAEHFSPVSNFALDNTSTFYTQGANERYLSR